MGGWGRDVDQWGSILKRNRNRGFRNLRVWQDAVELYVLACEVLQGFPFELKRTSSNAIDAAHSVSRNISEGYCRGSRKEYLMFLNYARASCGEFHSCYVTFLRAAQISQEDFDRLDDLHFKLENGLLALIASLGDTRP